MTDAVHSFHAPIYATTSGKRLPPSLYWGIGIAVLLHLLLAYYLIQQNFAGPAVVTPYDPPIIGTLYNPPTETAKPAPPPKSVIKVHEATLTTPPTETTPLAPVKGPVTETSASTPPVIASAESSAGSSTTSSSGQSYVAARWTRFPNGETLTDYYPPRALNDEMEGSATVQCVVLDAQGRVGCTVLAETPRGYNFGTQTVKMVQDKGRVDTTQGDVKIGSVLRTTVKWLLPQ